MRTAARFVAPFLCFALATVGILAAGADVPSRRVWMYLDDAGDLLKHQRSDLQQEVVGLWERYGINVEWQSGLPSEADVATAVLLVRVSDESLARQSSKAAEASTLGAVMFLPRHEKFLRTIFVSPRALRRILRRSGRLLDRTLLDRVLGQALGRVVAHELGHILLDMPGHTPTGLMKPTFDDHDLLEPTLDHLHVGPDELTILGGAPLAAADER